MNHRNFVKLHGYVAVFFLPMAMLYAVTGSLYIIGQSGTVVTTKVDSSVKFSWPQNQAEAFKQTNELLTAESLGNVNKLAQPRRPDNDTYLWRGMEKNVTLRRQGIDKASVAIQEHSLLRRLVEVHKNHAGLLFSILGVAFGIAMMILVLSGTWMMFKLRPYRQSATRLLSAGVAVSIIAYLATLSI